VGEGGSVVDAVADHRHPPAPSLELGHLRGLVRREDFVDDRVDAEVRPHCRMMLPAFS
jgi:hypothetical protein